MLAKTITTIIGAGMEKNADAENLLTQVIKAALPPVLELRVTTDDEGTYVSLQVDDNGVEPQHVVEAINALTAFGQQKAKEEAETNADDNNPLSIVAKILSKKVAEAAGINDNSSPAFQKLLTALVTVGKADLTKIKAEGGKAEDGPTEDAMAQIQAAFNQYVSDVKAAGK